MSLFEHIKHTIIKAVPFSLEGNYKSRNKEYLKLISKYYPEDGKIDIGNMNEDRMNIKRDIAMVFWDYKKAAAKEIRKRELTLE